MQKKRKQREILQTLEEEHKKEAYNGERLQVGRIQSAKSAPHPCDRSMGSPSPAVALLAQTVQDSITLSRLPTPEPTVFSGEPIQ